MAVRAVAQRFMVAGPSAERSLMNRDREQLIRKLVREMPLDKYPYVRRLLMDARSGQIDREAFMEFVRRTNTFSLVEEIHNWEAYSRGNGG